MIHDLHISDIDLNVNGVDVNQYKFNPASAPHGWHIDVVFPKGSVVQASIPKHPEIDFVAVTISVDGNYTELYEMKSGITCMWEFEEPVLLRVIPVFEKTQEYVDDLRAKYGAITSDQRRAEILRGMDQGIKDVIRRGLLVGAEIARLQVQTEVNFLLNIANRMHLKYTPITALGDLMDTLKQAIKEITIGEIKPKELIIYTDPATCDVLNAQGYALEPRIVCVPDRRWHYKLAIVYLQDNSTSEDIILPTPVIMDAYTLLPAVEHYTLQQSLKINL